MSKQKTKKSVSKKIGLTATGKLVRRHQLSGGHLKRNKSKGALERHSKVQTIFKGEVKAVKRMLGV